MKRIIFFDGVCPLCNGFVEFVLKKDTKNMFHFASLQSEFALQTLPPTYQGLDSIVLMEGQKVSIKSTAVLRVLFQLSNQWNFLSMLLSIVPVFLRDFVYDLVAKNRYRIYGKYDVCPMPPVDKRSYFLG